MLTPLCAPSFIHDYNFVIISFLHVRIVHAVNTLFTSFTVFRLIAIERSFRRSRLVLFGRADAIYKKKKKTTHIRYKKASVYR